MKITEIILTDLKEIKEKQSEHTAELKVYNAHLEEHISRQDHLESRFQPIEDSYKFTRKLLTLITVLLTIGASIAAIISRFH